MEEQLADNPAGASDFSDGHLAVSASVVDAAEPAEVLYAAAESPQQDSAQAVSPAPAGAPTPWAWRLAEPGAERADPFAVKSATLWPLSPLSVGLGAGLLAMVAFSGGGESAAPAAKASVPPLDDQGVPDDADQSLATVQGIIELGPVVSDHTLRVYAYNAAGQLLAQTPLNADGSYALNISSGYTGPVLLIVMDSDEGPDYMDEAAGAPRDLDAALRSVIVVNGPGQVTGHITPLTELVVRELGLATGQADQAFTTLGAMDAAQIDAVKAQVAKALGLPGVDLMSTRPEAIIDSNGWIDLSPANAYGRLLAALSGLEAGEEQRTDQVLSALAEQLDASAGTLSASALSDLLGGARLVAQAHPAARQLLSQVGQAMGLSAAQIDAIDTAWRTLLALADGQDNDDTGLSIAHFQALGVRGVDSDAKRDALNDVLDVQTSTAVRSRSKVQALADTVTVVLATAAGGTTVPSQAQLEELGLSQLNPARTAELIRAIAASQDDGSAVDTLAELQALVDTTPPATTASELLLAQRSGASSPPLTRTATQGLSATLSAPLAADERLLGSLDGGVTWGDISPWVSGTRVAMTAPLNELGRILLKVQDAAGNDGPVFEQAYVLDTQSPDLSVTQSNDQIALDGVINAEERAAGVRLSGSTEAGRPVLIATGMGADLTVNSDASTGAWSAIVPSDHLPTSGGVTFNVTTSDAAGNTTTVTRTVAVDAIAPDLVLTPVNANISTDGLINARERAEGVLLSGSTEAGRAVVIGTGTGADVSVTADATSGAWSATVPAAKLPTSGNVTFTVTSTDAVGNTASVTRTASVDTTEPNLVLTQTNANIALDGVINSAERMAGVQLSGSTEAGRDVLIATGTGADVSVTADGTGAWSATVPAAKLPTSGNVTFTVATSDAAGNIATLTRTVAVDTESPELLVTQTNANLAIDGVINADERSAGVLLSGRTEAGLAVVIATGTGAELRVTADATTGVWSATVPTDHLPATGEVTFSVTSSDAAGNTASITRTAAVDTQAPEVTLDPVATDDKVNASERTAGVLLSGTTEAGRSVRITTGSGSDAWITADATTGIWSTPVPADWLPANGTVNFSVTSSDAAGNTATVQRTVRVDTQAPEARLQIAAPALIHEQPVLDYGTPQLISLGADRGLAVFWVGGQAQSQAIFAQRLDTQGAPVEDPIALDGPVGGAIGDLMVIPRGGEQGGALAWSRRQEDGTWVVFAQTLAADGEMFSKPIPMASPGMGSAFAPSLAAVGTAGEFVLVWAGLYQPDQQDLGVYKIWLQRFDAEGAPLSGGPMALTSHPDTGDNQLAPQVTALGHAGGFVVVWRAREQADPTDWSLVAQRFDEEGQALGTPVFIEPGSLTDRDEDAPRVIALGNEGAFILVYESYDDDSDTSLVFMSHVSRAGVVSPALSLAAPGMEGASAWSPKVTALAGGDFVLTWIAAQAQGPEHLCVQRYSVNEQGDVIPGMALRLPAPSATAEVWDPQVLPWGNEGGFLLSWSTWGGQSDQALVQFFDAAGQPVGGAHHLQAPLAAGNYDPRMAAWAGDDPADGGLVLSWGSYDSEGESTVTLQRLDPQQPFGQGVAFASSADEGLTPASWLHQGDTVTVTLRFDEEVFVSGAPQLELQMGDATVHAAYTSGSGTADLVFSYTLQSGQADTDGILLGQLDLNGGAITDSAGNAAVLPHTGALQLNSGYRVDTQAPTAWAGVQEAVMVQLGEGAPPFAGAARILAGMDDVLLMSLVADGGDSSPVAAFVLVDRQGNSVTGFPLGTSPPSELAETMMAYDAWLDTDWLVMDNGAPAEAPTLLATVWLESDEEGSTILLRIVPISDPVPLASMPASEGRLSAPQIKVLDQDGSMVVTWAAVRPDGTSEIFVLPLDARNLDTLPEPLSQSGPSPAGMPVPVMPDLSVDLVRVEALGTSGAFVVACVGADDDDDVVSLNFDGEEVVVPDGQVPDDSIYLQLFASGGVPAGAPLRIEAPGVTDGKDGLPQLLSLGDDSFVLAWMGQIASGDMRWFVQRFVVNIPPDDISASTVTPAAMIELSPAAASIDWIPPLPAQLTALGNGSFVISWIGKAQDNAPGVFVQRFTNAGVALGDSLQLQAPYDSHTGDVLPKIAALGTDGAFAVAWSDWGGNIYVQRFEADGDLAGPASQLKMPDDLGMDTLNSNLQITALGDDGSYAVSWTARMDWGEGGNPGMVFVQRFNPDGSTSQNVSVEVGDDVRVSSSEPGTAYLVHEILLAQMFEADGIAALTQASSDRWNSVTIDAGYRSTELSTEGLMVGTYLLYTVDESGLWSARSEHVVTVDSNVTPPEVWLDGGTSGSYYVSERAWFESSEKGTAYLIRTDLTANLASVQDLGNVIASADPSLWNSTAVTRINWETAMPLAGLQPGVYGLYALDRGGLWSVASEETVTVGRDPVQLSSLASDVGTKVFGANAGDGSGTTVASAGDFNGDGFDDLLIGSPQRVSGGLAHIVFGGGARQDVNLAATSFGGWTLIGESAGDEAGLSLAAAGDVNGDGLADVIVGAPGANGGAGRSYVVFGRSGSGTIELSGLGSAGFVIEGETAGDRSGWGVGGGGDVNGDGLSDLIVGAPRVPDDGVRGNSYVVYGRRGTTAVELSHTLDASQGFVIQGPDHGDFAGRSVAIAGDVNGDGLADVIVGAPFSDLGGVNAGAAVVVFGSPSGSAVDAANLGPRGFVIRGTTGNPVSSESVIGVGDVNGDGLADLGLGVWGNGAATASYVVFGQTGAADIDLGSLGTQGLVIQARTDLSASNMRIGPAGDINGDGLADLIVGTRLVGGQRGISYVVFGQSQGGVVKLDEVAYGIGGFAIVGASWNDQSGSSVQAAGDVDGDGLADLLIGAPNADAPAGQAAGSSYVIFGSAAGQFAQTAVDQLGGSENNTFSDGGIPKTLVGGAGNDSLTAAAASVLYGGAGDDAFFIDADMIAALQSAMGRRGNDDQLARIDGGSGLDTLALIGANLTLDLTLMANPAAGVPHGGSRLSGIDIIDLTGTGLNKLVLTARDVLDLADFNVFAATGRRQLLVRGDAGDLIELPDLGWLQGDPATIGGSDCVVWNHKDSLATLYVAQDVFRLLSAEVLPPFGLV